MTNRRTRVLAAVVGIAVLAGLVGWLAGRQVRSPAQVAADAAPPSRSEITVPVESRVLSRDIETGVEASYGDMELVQILADETSVNDRVITGRVPDQGEELAEGSVIIEVAGRPTFVLEGEIPTFRTMRPGDSGVDVAQLETALERLGLLSAGNGSYDQSTEEAIRDLYQNAGYSPPSIPEFERTRLDFAEDAVDQAEEAVAVAQDALDLAPERTARLERDLERANDQLVDARDDLARTRSEVGVPMPQSELVFYSNLPRVVTEVLVESGDVVTGPVMSVSGGAFRLTGSLTEAWRVDVAVGDKAVVEDEGTGTKLDVTITEIADEPGTERVPNSRYFFAATPEGEFDADALARIGSLTMTIPLEQTDGEVLVVPDAAVDAGSVTVEREDGSVVSVRVLTGLEARGFVEIEPVDEGELQAGDRVVVEDQR